MGLSLYTAVALLVSLYGASADVFSYCNLQKPLSQEDPLIMLDTPQNQARFSYPRGAIEQALQRDSAARDYIRGQASLAGNSSARAAAAGRASNIQRTAPSTRKYDAPMRQAGMCSQKESRILGRFDDEGNFCFVIEDQVVPYYECAQAECDVHNAFPFYQKFYCGPASYVHVHPMFWCDNGPTKFMTVEVPVQCRCQKLSCNLDGMLV